MKTETFPILKLRLPEGFDLRDRDDHWAELLYRGEVVATFAAIGADPANIQKAIQATAEAIAADEHHSK